MRVLRGQASVLMTILEVFKFDPLQKWWERPMRWQSIITDVMAIGPLPHLRSEDCRAPKP